MEPSLKCQYGSLFFGTTRLSQRCRKRGPLSLNPGNTSMRTNYGSKELGFPETLALRKVGLMQYSNCTLAFLLIDYSRQTLLPPKYSVMYTLFLKVLILEETVRTNLDYVLSFLITE